MSQAQLAAHLSVTRAAISQYEQDKIRPRPVVVERLADFFNSDPEWFDRGRGKAPDALDAPVTILEINVALLTPQITDLRDLFTGRRWRLPAATFPGVELDEEHMVAITAQTAAGPIQQGDRVVIDIRRRRTREGLFLVAKATGAELCSYAAGLRTMGRAVAYLRSL